MNDISNSIFVTGTRGRCQSFVLLCGAGGVSSIWFYINCRNEEFMIDIWSN